MRLKFISSRILLAGVLLIACQLQANDQKVATKESTELLTAIQDQLATADEVIGNFEQKKFIQVLSQSLQSKGHFNFKKVSGLEWVVTEPLQSRLIFDDQGIRQDQDGQMQWQMNSQQPAVAAIGHILRAIISADWPILESYFTIDGQLSEKRWALTLRPKQDLMRQSVSHITVEGEQYLEAMVIFEASGDRTELAFQILDLKTSEAPIKEQ